MYGVLPLAWAAVRGRACALTLYGVLPVTCAGSPGAGGIFTAHRVFMALDWQARHAGAWRIWGR